MNPQPRKPHAWHGLPTRATAPDTTALLCPYHGLPARGIPLREEHGLEARDTERNPLGRRGFSFTEILFAVLILGIGFILVAGIFPVAIRQTQATAEETTASTIAKGGVSYLAKITSQYSWDLPATASPANHPVPDGLVHLIAPQPVASETANSPATNTALWPQISGNLILPSDNRYAWIPMYRQDVNAVGKYVQVIVIGVQTRNRPNYDPTTDLAARTAAAPFQPAALQARPLQANFAHPGNGQPDTVTLTDIGTNGFLGCASEGSYIVIANGTPSNTTTTNSVNGFVYRLGNAVAGTNGKFELAPGNDFTGATVFPQVNTPTVVYCVGSGYSDGVTSSNYSGPAQDIAVYSTFIVVH